MLPTLIANPQSGGSRGGQIFKQACLYFESQGWKFESCLTQDAGKAEKLALDAVNLGSRLIIVCGGDGTINEVVNGIIGSQTILGIIPAGRGNDLAKTLGVPCSIPQACHKIITGNTRLIDTISLGSRHFTTIASLGLAAQVNLTANRNFPGNSFSYLAPLAQALREYNYPLIQVEHDGGHYQGNFTLLAVANSAYFGGGMKIAPQARIDDGLMDICLVKKTHPGTIFLNLPGIYSGNHITKPYVMYWKSRELKVDSAIPLPIMADGEFFQSTPAYFKTHPGNLRIIV